jgi:hypothetical protein
MTIMALTSEKFTLRVVEELINRGAQVNWLITMPNKLTNREIYKNTTILDVYDFCHVDRICKLDDENYVLSKETIREYQDLECLFIDNTDRFSYQPVSVRARKYIYYKLLKYWLNFIAKNRLRFIFHKTSPHMGWDNVLYEVAKRNNIKNVFIARTLIENRVFLFSDYSRDEKVPVDFMQGLSKQEVIDKIDPGLYSTVWEKSLWIKRSENLNTLYNKEQSVVNTLKRNIDRSRRIRGATLIKYFSNYLSYLFEETHESTFFFNKRYKNINVELIRLMHRGKVKKMRDYYLSNCSEINYQRKYALFTMHFQPERSTLPEGEDFHHQLLAVQILSQSLPEDMDLYVKEHPRQFAFNDERNRHYRSIDEYRALLSLNNVRFISVHQSSNELVNNAVFVSTITGSIGWEAMLKNKPVIVFGNPWYQACNSCYKVSSVEECRKAVREITSSSPEDIEISILKYLCFIKDKLIISSDMDLAASKSSLPYDTLVNNLASAILTKID